MGGESIERQRRVKGREGGIPRLHYRERMMMMAWRMKLPSLSGWDGRHAVSPFLREERDKVKSMRKSNGQKIPRHCFHVSQSMLLVNFEEGRHEGGYFSRESIFLHPRENPAKLDGPLLLSLLLSSAVTPTRDVSEIRLRWLFCGPFCIPSPTRHSSSSSSPCLGFLCGPLGR